MQTMYDVSAFLKRFDHHTELSTALIELLDAWQEADEHGFGNQSLQERANTLADSIRSEYGLTKADIEIINDHEDAFRSHLRHPSRPR
jgi:hypothetical protein